MASITICLVNTNQDIIICSPDSCIKCLEDKCRVEVLKSYKVISPTEIKEWGEVKKQHKLQSVHVICRDNKH
jgi:hypothetical protein